MRRKPNQTLQTDNLTAARNVAMHTTHAAIKLPLSWALECFIKFVTGSN